MRYFKLVFAMTLLVAVLAFVAGNTSPVTLRFLVWETSGISLSLVAAVFFLSGILFTLLLGLLLRMRRTTGSQVLGKMPETVRPPKTPVETPQETTSGKDELDQ
ncbi:MAG: hypothetical protein C0624_05055 [Desulfuromonas sp.]|nr:MAG: hypothetical protein C0624_05055 [Desulfuromonas sp.]